MKEIRSLTGVRFFAAAWVVGFHLKAEIVEWCPSLAPLYPVLNMGYFAVPFFFMLSGFILSYVYFPTYSLRHHGHFIWLRFARLWPVHVAMILALLAYIAATMGVRGHYVPAEPYPMAALPWDLLMVRCWFSTELFWNFPAWSIHCEWLAYLLVFPVCFQLFRAIRQPLVLLLILALLLTAQVYLADRLPGRCGEIVFLFMAGSALYRLKDLRPTGNGPLMVVGGAILFILGCLTEQAVAFNLAFGFLVLGLSYEQDWISRICSSRLLLFGGAISYSLYMTHEVVHKFASEVTKRLHPQTEPMGYAILLGLVGAMLIAATLTHKLIEVPANRRLRRIGRAD